MFSLLVCFAMVLLLSAFVSVCVSLDFFRFGHSFLSCYVCFRLLVRLFVLVILSELVSFITVSSVSFCPSLSIYSFLPILVSQQISLDLFSLSLSLFLIVLVLSLSL